MIQPKNLKAQIEKCLSPETKNIINDCAKIAQEKDFRIYLVGGIVRDLLLERKIYDIDVTVQGDAIEFCKILQAELDCKIIQIQNDLRTAKVKFSNSIEIDFASTRKEEYPEKGHLPIVTETGCSLSSDVYRRDFTVNAISSSLNQNNFGEIEDFTGGLEDLKKKKLRILYEKSFIDDPSRIIRGLKFSVRLGFELEEKTKQQQDEYLKNPNRNLSWFRIKSELQQAFSLNVFEVLDKCVEQKIYKIFSDTTNKNIKAQDVFNIINKYKSEITYIWLVYFGVLLTDKETIELFNFEKNEKRLLVDALEMIHENFYTKDLFEIYKFFENKCIESILIFYLVTKNENAILFLNELRKHKVLTTGDELINMGFLPGLQFKQIFDSVLQERLKGNIQNKQEELNFIKTLKNS